jgi:hypothetical protein
MQTSFARVIEEHLQLKRRNEAQARSDPGEDSASDVDSEPALTAAANGPLVGAFEDEDSLWGRAREFDWGDLPSATSGNSERSEDGC